MQKPKMELILIGFDTWFYAIRKYAAFTQAAYLQSAQKYFHVLLIESFLCGEIEFPALSLTLDDSRVTKE